MEAASAARTVAMQSERATSPSPHDELFDGIGFRSAVDFRFLVVALRWLQDIAEHVARATANPGLKAAIKEYENAIPEARDMRNLGEHLPEYLVGSGRMQHRKDLLKQRGHVNQLGVMVWTGSGDHGSRLTWTGTNVDADEARVAADRLFVAIRDATNQ
jgi:hypothetical protein